MSPPWATTRRWMTPAVAVGLARMQRLRYEPYHVLAQLNANVFVNTNPTSLLLAVLVHAGKRLTQSTVRGMTVRSDSIKLTVPLQRHMESTHRRTPWSTISLVISPLPGGYVLTEDDYFDS
ncbi:MAG: hypothetical protein R2854_11060 [Caldilineaceae bacterium]